MSHESAYRIINGNGPRLRKRTADQKRRTRDKARRLQQETVVSLSDFLPRPLSYAWEDGRRGQQRWWGNLLNHATELVDSDTPPTFEQLLMMAEVLVWHMVDLCQERGIPVDLPDPPTPIQRALLKRVA